MKKILMIGMMAGAMAACNNGKTSNEKMGEDVEPYRGVPVENVNGNIPDTTNSIDLSPRAPDSSKVVDSPLKK